MKSTVVATAFLGLRHDYAATQLSDQRIVSSLRL